jgi:hypothetical protein
MRDLMIDIETLGTEAGCVVLSFAAVLFGKEPIDISTMENIYFPMPLQKQLDVGLTVNADTLNWWSKQNNKLFADTMYAASSKSADELFINWTQQLHDMLASHGVQRVKRVWCNGANFDGVIAREAFKRLGYELPWSGFDERCFRTLKDLFPVTPPKRIGAHNALEDCLYQIEIIQSINSKYNLDIL